MARYTTGELAKLCDVTVRTVQYYDSKGLLKPSDLSDGGRRLYSDEDLTNLRIICFLKDLGFSLKDISTLLHEPDTGGILGLLVQNQEESLRRTIDESRQKLSKLAELQKNLTSFNTVTPRSIGVMANIVDGNKKLRAMRIQMLAVGLVMDAAWISTLVYGIVTGTWWPFAIGLAVAVVLGVAISVHYARRVAYVCPEDHTVFRPPMREMLFAAHKPTVRKLTCPTCGYRGYCLEVYALGTEPERVGKTLIWPEGGDAR